MGAITLSGAVAIVWLARGWDLFFYDEWGTIFYRRSGGVDAFLAPHNGHLQAVVIGVYRALFATVGLEHYLPYRLAMVVAHVVLVALVYVYARRRVQPELALAFAVLVLMLGKGWEVIFWPINLGFVVPLIALLANLLLADRPGRRAAAARTFLLLGGVASSSVGVVIAAAVGADALWRSDRRTRVLEAGAVLAAWAAWFLIYRPSASTPPELRQVPGAAPAGDIGAAAADLPTVAKAISYLVDLAQAGAAGLFGLDGASAGWIALILLGVVGATLVKRPAIRPRVVTLCVGLGGFWLSLVVARGDIATGAVDSRFIFVSSVLVALILLECLRGIVLPRFVLPVLAALTVAVLLVDIRTFESINDAARVSFDRQREQLRRLAREEFPPSFRPDPVAMPNVAAGPYKAAVAELGYPRGVAP